MTEGTTGSTVSSQTELQSLRAELTLVDRPV